MLTLKVKQRETDVSSCVSVRERGSRGRDERDFILGT
jgi:hypothetical protein